MTYKVVLLQPIEADLAKRVMGLVPDGFELIIAKTTDKAEHKQLIADADYAVAFGMAIENDVLAEAKKLKLLHRWGVGMDGVPVEKAREMGIPIAKTTGSNARPVAEYTVGAMIATSRHFILAHRGMQEGRWLKKDLWPNLFMLCGKKIAIVGMGTIGALVAKRLAGFEATVVYNKRTRLSAEQEKELGVTYADMDEIIDTADVISLHCPLTDETRDLIDKAALKRMKPSAVLINTARGGVVNEADLAWALKNGEIRSAVLDVFGQEPPEADNPLLSLDNVIATPHIAAIAFENVDNSVGHWFGNIQRHARGEPIPDADMALRID